LKAVARRESSGADGLEGFNDLIGIVLISLSLLLVVALFSYDPNDLPINSASPNSPKHNWIGPIGAYLAHWSFFVVGAAAYVGPVLLFGFGLAHLFKLLAYLRRRWLWGIVLLIACMCMLDLYSGAFATLKANLNAPSAGGLIGMTLNNLVFDHFGKLGAPILLATLYAVSLLLLTNFQLGEWLRALWRLLFRRAPISDERDRALERRARELAHQADRLRQQIERSGLGADLQPVPEPTVRDLSIPQPKSTRPKEKSPPAETKREIEPADEGEIIPAGDIEAAVGETPVKAGKSKPAPAVAEATPSESLAPAPGTTLPASGAEPADDDSSTVEPVLAAPKPKPAPRKPRPIAVAPAPKIGNYQLPPLALLHPPDPNTRPTESKEELMANARLMQQTLAQFDIEVALGDITKGPTITRYELHPAPGVKLEKITALTNNMAAALKAERIHILAPVPGKSSVGVEVPNVVKTKVIMRDLLESEEWQHTKARIPLALGKDVYGHPIIADLSEMPHLLIAGSTGSGKSVNINAIISSLLYRFAPDQLRFVMIDPKVVELQHYNSLPHLVVPVVTDPKKVILALRWVVNEMEKRYQIFARVGVRNIKSFNERPKGRPAPPAQPELPLTARKEKIEAGSDGFAVEVDEEIVVPRDDDIVIPDKLSYIVVVIDELADLMLVAPADVEMAIARITQMARAAGIHCIVATQRPSVDVITGVIKANIPARIAFQVAAKVDSRTILDAMGADKLLGKGDMLYLPPGSAKLIRAQGALITDPEIHRLVEFITRQGKPSYDVEIHEQLSKPALGFDEENGCDEDEGLIQQCIEVIRSEQKASVSLLQRRLRLGYTRAARIMDELENRGIVGPNKGAEPRDILIDLDGGGADGRQPVRQTA
jgi:S-DNA-T family DNA segregation ATPase FtsK/SpoIIIE